MALYRVEGLVLRSRELGEADRLVTLWSRTEGKLRAVARGSRRPRSRLAAATQPFCHGHYLLMRGRELDSLTQAEVAGHGLRPLREDLTRMTLASLTAELVDALTEERAPVEGLFEDLLGCWQALAAGEGQELWPVVWWFELRLMDRLGYGPSLERCAGCGAALPQGPCPFSAAEGGCLCAACRPRDPMAPVLSQAARQALLRWRARAAHQAGLEELAPPDRAQLGRALEGFVQHRLPGRLQSLGVAQALAGPAGRHEGGR